MTDPCATWRALLSPRLDDELTAAEASGLERHLAACAACRVELAQLTTLRDAVTADLRALVDDAPPTPAEAIEARAAGEGETRGEGAAAGPRPMGPSDDADPARPGPEPRVLWTADPAGPAPPGATTRPIPPHLRWAATVVFLLFVGAWLLDDSDDDLRARAVRVAADLWTPGQRHLVHGRPPEQLDRAPARATDALTHLFEPGHRGAYLWQLAGPAQLADPSAGFDPARYLVGSDGASLWTLDPAADLARTLPVDAVPDPLPRTLALVLADLEAAALRTPGPVHGRGPWREVEVPVGEGPDAPRVRVLFDADEALVGLEVLPRPDLAVFLEPFGEPALQPSGVDPFATLFAPPTPRPGLELLALEPPDVDQPDVLWQLGYTPGAPPATWPEQLSALAQELGTLGYL